MLWVRRSLGQGGQGCGWVGIADILEAEPTAGCRLGQVVIDRPDCPCGHFAATRAWSKCLRTHALACR